jgi:hypothetical protein
MTSIAPAALNLAIMTGFVLVGTTTDAGKPSETAAVTHPSPALPPDDEKKCRRFEEPEEVCFEA